MSANKRLALAFVRLACTYALLVAAWWFVAPAYGTFYRAFGTFVFHDFGPDAVTVWRPLHADHPAADTEIVLTNRQVAGAAGRMLSSSRYTGYAPTIVLLALVVATPITWRRRAIAAILGLLLVHAFIVLRLGLSLLHAYSAESPIQAWRLAEPLDATVTFIVTRVWTSSLTCSFVVPTLIWALVTLRRSDWSPLPGNKPD